MKRILFLIMVAAIIGSMSSCDFNKSKKLQSANDSLTVALSEKDAELNEIMGTINEVQEGFREISEAENRVDLSGEVSENRRSKIQEDIKFISDKLKENREQIASLEKKLKNSKYRSTQLRKAVEGLTQDLKAKQEMIENLQEALSKKNIRIAELDDAVAGLSLDLADMGEKFEKSEAKVKSQDAAINAAWFVYGYKSELKEQRIIVKGEVLESNDFNKDYFTQIDIRDFKQLKLYAKRAKMLTTHPEGSYKFVRDDKGQKVLEIIDAAKFWSVSRYLVIQVR